MPSSSALGVWLLWSLLSVHTTAYVTQKPFFERHLMWLVFRGGAGDGGLGQEGVGVPHLHGGDDAPRQDLAMQGSLFDPPLIVIWADKYDMKLYAVCCDIFEWSYDVIWNHMYESQGNQMTSYGLSRNNHGMLCGLHDVLGYDCLLLDDNTM